MLVETQGEIILTNVQILLVLMLVWFVKVFEQFWWKDFYVRSRSKIFELTNLLLFLTFGTCRGLSCICTICNTLYRNIITFNKNMY